MNLDVKVYREALLEKGLVSKGRILAHPRWACVCFTHAVQLAMQGTPIREEIESHGDHFMGNDRCSVCNSVHKENWKSFFEKSINDNEPEYKEPA